MPHLSEEEILQAALAGRGTTATAALPKDRRSHLGTCTLCSTHVSEMQNFAAALRESEPDVQPPSFDSLIAPALITEHAEPAAAKTGTTAPSFAAGSTIHLVGALVIRQARLVPVSLWPLTAIVLAALFVFTSRAPDPAIGAVFFGPGATLLATGAALTLCSPSRDPRSEMLYSMSVPPAVVWLTRLILVMGTVLAASALVSVASAVVMGSPQAVGPLIASWLGPAVLGMAMTVFGTVWRSPAVGVVFGTGSWFMSVLGTRVTAPLNPLPDGTWDAVVTLWSTTPVNLLVSAVLLTATTWLVSRSGRSLNEE